MEGIPGSLVKSLQNLGLTHFEAQVYAALVMFDHAEVKEIVDFLPISKPSVYDSLDQLAEMGLAVKSNSKPVRYNAVSPDMAIDILMGNNLKASENALEQLKKLEKKKTLRTSDVLWTLYGGSTIEYKIRDMLGDATHTIECILGERYLPFITYIPNPSVQLNLAMVSDDPGCQDRVKIRFPQKNAKICILSMKNLQMIPHFMPVEFKEIHKYLAFENLFSLIIDDEELLLIPPITHDSISALNTKNKGAIFFLKMFGQSHWGNIFE